MFSCRPKTHMHQKCKCPSMLETKQTTKQQDSFVSTYKYRNGLLPMQYVFLIRSSAGCEKYVTRRSRVTYFSQPARERIKNTYCMGNRPFLFLLLIYMRFLTIFYAKTMGLSFIATVVRHYDSGRVCHGACS